MRMAAIALLLYASTAVAMIGTLVGQSTRYIGGQMYTVCSYNVGGQVVSRLIPGPAVCPVSIDM